MRKEHLNAIVHYVRIINDLDSNRKMRALPGMKDFENVTHAQQSGEAVERNPAALVDNARHTKHSTDQPNAKSNKFAAGLMYQSVRISIADELQARR